MERPITTVELWISYTINTVIKFSLFIKNENNKNCVILCPCGIYFLISGCSLLLKIHKFWFTNTPYLLFHWSLRLLYWFLLALFQPSQLKVIVCSVASCLDNCWCVNEKRDLLGSAILEEYKNVCISIN